MSVNYNTPTITDRLIAVKNHIDGGSTNGTLRLTLSDTSQVVAVIPLQSPCGSVISNILTFTLPLTAPTVINALSSNPLAYADVRDSNGTVIISGLTVGLSTAYDIVMVSNNILAGQGITLTSATITGV
jgi:hypothetical protein